MKDPVTCPICANPSTIERGIYSEPVVHRWSGGTTTEMARLLAWEMSCGHLVKGDEYHLFIDVSGDGSQTAEFRPGQLDDAEKGKR